MAYRPGPNRKTREDKSESHEKSEEYPGNYYNPIHKPAKI